MSRALDQLAKDLAAGVSRRKALWRFVGGLGVLGVLAPRKGSAIVAGQPFAGACESFCQEQAQLFVNICMAASTNCSPGSCAEFTTVSVNGTSPATILAINGGIPFSGQWVCVPDSVALPGGGRPLGAGAGR